MKYYTRIETPYGNIGLAEDGKGISDLYFEKNGPLQNAEEKETPLLKKAKQQLQEYFAGERKTFDLPLSLQGTDFQIRDWNALCTIPYGETRTYGEIAKQIGNPKASRAVGMANHNNPISIIIPCHRVIGANGALVGYGGGLDMKVFLLELEAKHR